MTTIPQFYRKYIKGKSIIKLSFSALAVRLYAAVLGFVFIAIAPNYMGDLYVDYVYYIKVMTTLSLVFAFASAGVFNRHVPFIEEHERIALVAFVFKIKLLLFLIAIGICLLYIIFIEQNFVYLIILGIGIFYSLFEAMNLYLYSLEDYKARLSQPLILSTSKLALLPVSDIAVILFIVLSELSAFIYSNIKFVKKISLRKILNTAYTKNNDIDKKKILSTGISTYFSNLLFFFLPAYPILLMNSFDVDAIRAHTIIFNISVVIIFTPFSAVQSIILPKIVNNANNKYRLYFFIGSTFVLTLLLLIVVMTANYFFHSDFVAYYEMPSLYDIAILFLLYSSCLCILNTLRQILFAQDKLFVFIIMMTIYYLSSYVLFLFHVDFLHLVLLLVISAVVLFVITLIFIKNRIVQ